MSTGLLNGVQWPIRSVALSGYAATSRRQMPGGSSRPGTTTGLLIEGLESARTPSTFSPRMAMFGTVWAWIVTRMSP